MEFTCHTTYDQKTLTAMARALRKTVRAKRNRILHIYTGVIIAVLLVSLWLSWGSVWQMAVNGTVIVALLLVAWKEDAINGYFARRRALPGTEAADTSFHDDHYLVKMAAAESKWQYQAVEALAETHAYIVLVMGNGHAQALQKAALQGGSVPEFCRFLEEKCGCSMQKIGG